jgi:hypothetical protein
VGIETCHGMPPYSICFGTATQRAMANSSDWPVNATLL